MYAITVHCNHCNLTQTFAAPTLAELIAALDGWLLCMVWRYYAAGYCPVCQEDG